MPTDWLFWAIAAAAAVLSLAVVFAPLMVRPGRTAARPSRRSSYDLQVHRDQLREVEADAARGVLSPAEAAATRIEVSRRLLATAQAEMAETDAAVAPQGLRRAAPVMVAVLAAAGLGLYAYLGTPWAPDQPLAAREAAAAEDARLLALLQEALAGRPDDLEGHRLLARQLAAHGRWPEALAAEERVVAILGPDAGAADLVALAEARIIVAGGIVTSEAAAEIARALALDPSQPVGRYYLGLGHLQSGRPEAAFATWAALVEEGPPDAPWIAPAREGMAEAARAAAGPADEGEQAAMIEAMVGGLAARLAEQGGPPEEWAKLIRSLGVLGRRDQAAAVAAEARRTFAGDAAAQSALDAAAAAAGVAE